MIPSLLSKPSHLRAAAACGLIFAVSLGSLAACSKSQTEKTEDTMASAAANVSEGVGNMAADMAANKSQDFVTKAAIANMFEIETSKAALAKSANKDVKAFAQQMVTDHTKAGKAFEAALAKTSGFTAPTALDEDHQKKLDDLNAQTGADFDKKYADLQKDAHDDAVNLFDNYSKDGDDAALKAFATETLPTLQMHKDHVANLNP